MSIQDPFKKAADQLRKSAVGNDNGKLKAGHAHEIVAAAFQFNTKASLIAAGFELDPEDPEGYELGYDRENLQFVEKRMEDLGLDPKAAMQALEVISEAISPVCDYCGSESYSSPVHGGPGNQKWVCQACIRSNREEIGHCWCCGSDVVHHASELNENNECSDHKGESNRGDEDEAEDMNNFAEYLQSHDPI